MMNGPFRESEAADIYLTDICPYAAHQMLLFIHTDMCEILMELKATCTYEEKRQRREALMALISAADKYDVQVGHIKAISNSMHSVFCPCNSL